MLTWFVLTNVMSSGLLVLMAPVPFLLLLLLRYPTQPMDTAPQEARDGPFPLPTWGSLAARSARASSQVSGHRNPAGWQPGSAAHSRSDAPSPGTRSPREAGSPRPEFRRENPVLSHGEERAVAGLGGNVSRLRGGGPTCPGASGASGADPSVGTLPSKDWIACSDTDAALAGSNRARSRRPADHRRSKGRPKASRLHVIGGETRNQQSGEKFYNQEFDNTRRA